jgi:hypothetical protein
MAFASRRREGLAAAVGLSLRKAIAFSAGLMVAETGWAGQKRLDVE